MKGILVLQPKSPFSHLQQSQLPQCFPYIPSDCSDRLHSRQVSTCRAPRPVHAGAGGSLVRVRFVTLPLIISLVSPNMVSWCTAILTPPFYIIGYKYYTIFGQFFQLGVFLLSPQFSVKLLVDI
jgi:hypothetical protein